MKVNEVFGHRLTDDELTRYEQDGHLTLRGQISGREVRELRSLAAALAAQSREERVLEADGKSVRSVYAVHRHSQPFRDLAADARLVGPVTDVLGEGLYLHQSRVNFKDRLTGDAWPWHEDFPFWWFQDGMREPSAVTVAVFLDHVGAHNGPLLVIPGSHRSARPLQAPTSATADLDGFLSADLAYEIRDEDLVSWARDRGVVPCVGPAGTVVLFHPRIAHASAPNLSPQSRRMLFYVFNSLANIPERLGHRPSYLAEQDCSPIDGRQEAGVA